MSETIRKFRLTFGETQEEFARRLQVSAVTIARYETNSRPRPTILKRLAAIARDYHLDEYARVFAGDESEITELKEREFEAAIQVLGMSSQCLASERFRAVRAAIALIESRNIDLDRIEEILGFFVIKADELIQKFASRLDLEEAKRRHNRISHDGRGAASVASSQTQKKSPGKP